MDRIVMQSLNFEFLREGWPQLAELGGFAERYLDTDPQSACTKMRLLAEEVARGCGCGAVTEAAAGHVEAGTARCPACGRRERLIDLAARTGSPPTFRLFAVETVPAGPEKRYAATARRIRAASARDV